MVFQVCIAESLTIGYINKISSAKAQSKVILVNLRINGADLIGVILRAKTTEKRHRINMRRNSKMYSLVSMVQIVGYHVLQVIQEARDGTVYSVHGWDTAYQRIQRTAKQFKTGYDGQLPSRTFKPI